jgi:hypothetical protein
MWDDYDGMHGRKTSKADPPISLKEMRNGAYFIPGPVTTTNVNGTTTESIKHISELQGTSEFVEIDSGGRNCFVRESEICGD